MNGGVSIVICCFNSSLRLPDTLKHICGLEVPSEISFELIVVDNNSTDHTSETAGELLRKFKFDHPYKILFQSEQGLSFSRKMGIENSTHEYIIFCDDDNWLDRDYVMIGKDLMDNNPEAAIIGGQNTAVADSTLPNWFEEYSKSYAVGQQSETNGKMTSPSDAIWGAGMILRKGALNDLYSMGFTPLLSDRKKNNLTSGGDVELCYALKLAGWEIHYYSSLKLKHFIPDNRLSWKYLRKLNRGFGAQKVALDAYLRAINGNSPCEDMTWRMQLFKFIGRLRGYGFRKLSKFNKLNEGDFDTLRIEKTIGRITELMKTRGRYDETIKLIRDASWNKNINNERFRDL